MLDGGGRQAGPAASDVAPAPLGLLPGGVHPSSVSLPASRAASNSSLDLFPRMDRFLPRWVRILAGLGAHHEVNLLGNLLSGQPRLSPRSLVIVGRLYDLKNPAIRVDEARDAIRQRRPSSSMERQ